MRNYINGFLVFFVIGAISSAKADIIWESNQNLFDYSDRDNLPANATGAPRPAGDSFTGYTAFEFILQERYEITGIGGHFQPVTNPSGYDAFLIKTDLVFNTDSNGFSPADPLTELTLDFIVQNSLVSGIIAIPPSVGPFDETLAPSLDVSVAGNAIAEPGRYVLAFSLNGVGQTNFPDQGFEPGGFALLDMIDGQRVFRNSCDGPSTIWAEFGDLFVIQDDVPCVRAFVTGRSLSTTIAEPTMSSFYAVFLTLLGWKLRRRRNMA